MTPMKKKVGIFTLTHALNYGAFYQMYGMARYFETLGYDVTVFDCQRTLKYRMLRLFSYHPSRQVRKLVLHSKYRKDRAAIQVRPYKGEALDLAILGSDEIWNLENSSFEHSPEYLGLGISARKVIAYAPSIGYAKPQTLLSDPQFLEGLCRADGILARDAKTRLVAERATGKSIVEVADPTILFNAWDEMLSNKPQPSEDYILYYGYTGNPLFKPALLDFAKGKGLKIYTAGFRTHNWCDENLTSSPRDFLDLMKGAKYVCTDTFHGLVMSALLDKSVAFSAPMQKIRDFAAKIGIAEDALTERSVSAEMEEALDRDRTERNKLIGIYSVASRTILSEMIEGVSQNPTATGT